MEKKLELVREFTDFEELEDYKASLKSIERRVKKSRVIISGRNFEFRDLNYKLVESRNFGEYTPVRFSKNREYVILQRYVDGIRVAQLRNYKGDRIWEREFEGRIFDALVSDDGKNSIFFKGKGTTYPVVNQLEFYDEKGDLIKNVYMEERIIYAEPRVFSDKNSLLLFWSRSLKVSEEGGREVFGVVFINAFDLTGNELWEFTIKEEGIHDIKVSEDGKIIVAVGEGEGKFVSDKWEGFGHIYFIDEKGELINEHPFNYGRRLGGIKFSSYNTEHSIIYIGQNIFLFETTTGKIVGRYEDPKIYFFLIDVSKVGDIIAGGYGEIPNLYLVLLNYAGEKITEIKVDNPEDLDVERVEISDNGEIIFLEFVNKALVFRLIQNG